MTNPERRQDPFHARDSFHDRQRPGGHLPPQQAGRGRPDQGRPVALFHPRAAGSRAAELRRQRGDRTGRGAAWPLDGPRPAAVEVPFKPARVLLQDFTGVPAVVDLAAMRSAMKRLGGDPEADQPAGAGQPGDRPFGAGRFLRLARRRWGRTWPWSSSGTASATSFSAGARRRFANFRVVPPSVGIVHQVNLEFLAKCVFLREDAAGPVAVPDTLVGTDSHTTDDQRPGRAGLGRGRHRGRGRHARPAALHAGPRGGRLRADRRSCRPGTTATDLVLTVTQILPQGGRGQQVRRVFRPGHGAHQSGRSRPGGQHGARVRRHRGLLPHRRADAGLSARDGPLRLRSRAGRALRQGAATLPRADAFGASGAPAL